MKYKIILFLSLFILLGLFCMEAFAASVKQGNSATYPEMIVISNDLYQIRYNIHEVIKEDELKGKHTSYSYDYIEAKEITSASIDLELQKNGVKEDADRKKMIEVILGEKEKHPPKKIIKLREAIGSFDAEAKEE